GAGGEAEDIEAWGESERGGTQDVGGIRGAFEPVHQRERGVALGRRLPVTLPQDARPGLDLEQPRNRARQPFEPPRPEVRRESHQMRVAQQRMGFEPSHDRRSSHTLTSGRKEPKGSSWAAHPGRTEWRWAMNEAVLFFACAFPVRR